MSVNTDALMKEMTTVLKTGLDKLFSDYNDRYTLYEETHKCVVKLQGLLGNDPSPQSDTRYDKLEKQIDQMKEEIALLKGKSIYDLVDDDEPLAVKTQVKQESTIKTQVKQEPTIKTQVKQEPTIKAQVKQEPTIKAQVKQEPTIKAQVKQEPTIKAQEPNEKENITLIIEPVQKQESEGYESEDEDKKGEHESEGDEEESEEEDESEVEDEEEEQEELSDEEEEKPAAVTPTIAPADDEDEELFEVEIDDVSYCTNDEENGIIYALTEDGDVGAKVGYLKDGEPIFE